jgi:glycosyltransferase involved in cell wall biosynthesis
VTAGEVTVAICTRNRPDEVSRCLGSLSELHPRPAAIVVADQSDDDPAATVRALCSRYAAGWFAPPRRGLGASRLAVVERVTTTIVAFTDDDCFVRPGWVGAIASVFARHPDAGAATGPVRPHPSMPLPDGVPAWVSDWGEDREIVFTAPTDPSRIGGGLNMAFRVDALRRAGGFDPMLGAGGPLRGGEDADAFHRILLGGGHVVYTPDAVVSHRPPRDAAAQDRNEIDYAWGLGAWVERRRGLGDRVPERFWREALRRCLSTLVRHAPADGAARTWHRVRVAGALYSGRRDARRLIASSSRAVA